ncbi:uncharacterized protein PV09_09365 [Verruconis gallopava]|uniref:Uncharacterized protein n=1 Tax=Verruconis gallopava TaxID=253628 RepID=A0A0D1YDQ7_9PEZI|nr:uncharacterized protein PV09_09365 [Verruconis gallopava]KIV98871.1 hypothetical protein PV09_09365 [Verruconis gallopava]
MYVCLTIAVHAVRSWLRPSLHIPRPNEDRISQPAARDHLQREPPSGCTRVDVPCRMKGSHTHLARILVLKEEEVCQYMSHYGRSGVYDDSASVMSARAGFQMFASMVLWFLGGDALKQLDERPTRFRARLKNAFLKIDPNIGTALAGMAYAVGKLERDAPDFCVVYYLLLLEAAMHNLFKQGLEDDMITVIQESASFQTVDYMLCEQLKRSGVRYDGDLKRDLEIGLIRAKGVAAFLRTWESASNTAVLTSF